MTNNQLLKACRKHPYLILTHATGVRVGINSKVAEVAIKKRPFDGDKLSKWQGFKPCTFMEYLNIKGRFV